MRRNDPGVCEFGEGPRIVVCVCVCVEVDSCVFVNDPFFIEIRN